MLKRCFLILFVFCFCNSVNGQFTVLDAATNANLAVTNGLLAKANVQVFASNKIQLLMSKLLTTMNISAETAGLVDKGVQAALKVNKRVKSLKKFVRLIELLERAVCVRTDLTIQLGLEGSNHNGCIFQYNLDLANLHSMASLDYINSAVDVAFAFSEAERENSIDAAIRSLETSNRMNMSITAGLLSKNNNSSMRSSNANALISIYVK